MLLGTISAMKFIISWDQNPQVRDSIPKRDKADLKIEKKEKRLNLALKYGFYKKSLRKDAPLTSFSSRFFPDSNLEYSTVFVFLK